MVSATVENVGDAEVTETVTLDVDGTQVDSRSLTLAGGASETVTFDYDTDGLAAGDHDVTVTTDNDSETAQFTTTVDDDPTGHTLRVVGSGPRSDYAFSGSVATGAVWAGGFDEYTFTDSLDEFSVTGDATVYVDGEPVDPASVA